MLKWHVIIVALRKVTLRDAANRQRVLKIRNSLALHAQPVKDRVSVVIGNVVYAMA